MLPFSAQTPPAPESRYLPLLLQEEITDRASIQLTRTFYRALANGLPVDAAVAEACMATSVGLRHSARVGHPDSLSARPGKHPV